MIWTLGRCAIQEEVTHLHRRHGTTVCLMSVQDHGRSVSHVDALRQAVRVCETFDVDRRFAAGALGEYVGTSRANDVDRSVMVLAELGVRLRSTLGDEVLRRRWEYQLANRQVRGVYVTDCTRWLTSREALSRNSGSG